ncbi:hypothetical protein [Flavobacterium granuli]|uniref:Uncharacterized protein n=1 Tax=Flavobacterium granuli TaxID=280093 RepID=A0A1M5PF88_9FLAO|nr:hypothetical protein [Flavobacterium granuli]PRZ26460.1 hypothetical protein BC624_102432 [Flavobacterium granuli]SHH00411.1 hypothetical protein SAMN05443373_10629 [Flavobacterium granuli]
MKKKLEADLISIAHRILQLKNKSDINQLYLETQKLYEKLSVLRFVDAHYGEVKPTIGYAEIEKEIESFYDNESEIVVATIETPEINLAPEAPIEETFEKEAVVAEMKERDLEIEKEEVPTEEAIEADSSKKPLDTEETLAKEKKNIDKTIDNDEEIDAVELSNEESLLADETDEDTEKEDEIIEETPAEVNSTFEVSEEIKTPAKPEAVQISFEDILGGNYNNTLFVKVDDVPAAAPTPVFEPVKETVLEQKVADQIIENKSEKAEPKSLSLNEKLAKGINIDLNDQIAFVKHLFGNSNEDYNRVLNQLITFDNFYETRNFIEEMVKPDYNNWEGKADYEERFMDIIEKKFL